MRHASTIDGSILARVGSGLRYMTMLYHDEVTVKSRPLPQSCSGYDHVTKRAIPTFSFHSTVAIRLVTGDRSLYEVLAALRTVYVAIFSGLVVGTAYSMFL